MSLTTNDIPNLPDPLSMDCHPATAMRPKKFRQAKLAHRSSGDVALSAPAAYRGQHPSALVDRSSPLSHRRRKAFNRNSRHHRNRQPHRRRDRPLRCVPAPTGLLRAESECPDRPLSNAFGGPAAPSGDASAQSRQPQSSPPNASPGFGDRAMAGLSGLVTNARTGPAGALLGGLGGFVTGQRSGPILPTSNSGKTT
jgi:hypothetical protein